VWLGPLYITRLCFGPSDFVYTLDRENSSN